MRSRALIECFIVVLGRGGGEKLVYYYNVQLVTHYAMFDVIRVDAEGEVCGDEGRAFVSRLLIARYISCNNYVEVLKLLL